MAQRHGATFILAHRGAADHHRFRPVARIVHVGGAGGVPHALHLHDVPHDAAAADPACRRTDLRHRGGRNRPLLSRDHRLFRFRLRRAVQGIQPRLDRRRRRARLWPSGRLRQRLDHRQGRHPVVHDHARHPVLLGRHGDRPVGRQVLRFARRRREFGVAMASSAGRSPRRRPSTGCRLSRCRRCGRR